MKTSEARGQHFRPVLFAPSGDAVRSSTTRTGRIRSKVSVVWMLGSGLWRKCGICGLELPAGSSALRAMLVKVLLQCFLTRSSPPAGNCGSLCKLSSLRRLFRMDCKGSRWHLNTTQHSSYSNDLENPAVARNLFNFCNTFYEKCAVVPVRKPVIRINRI